jgi:hypothetical protein
VQCTTSTLSGNITMLINVWKPAKLP